MAAALGYVNAPLEEGIDDRARRSGVYIYPVDFRGKSHGALLALALPAIDSVDEFGAVQAEHLHRADVADPEVGVQRFAQGKGFASAVGGRQFDVEDVAHRDAIFQTKAV